MAFFLLGIIIFWLIYKDQDIERIKSVLKNNVIYFWIILSLVIGLLSHISRTIRWSLMIEPVAHKPGFFNTYLMNLALPRMGEVSRRGVMARYEKISFTKLFGTVVAERLVDMISLLLLLLAVIITQMGKLLDFLHQNPEIEEKLNTWLLSPWLLILFFVVILLIFVFRKSITQSFIYRKISGILHNFREGFVSIRSIRKKGWFYFHSALIWVLYYLMLYVTFYAFDFTRDLNPIAGLTTFVMASFGMVAPVQGGIGAWHFMAKEALALYGVANENGIIFAFVVHSSSTAMIIVVGLLSLLALPFVNRNAT